MNHSPLSLAFFFFPRPDFPQLSTVFGVRAACVAAAPTMISDEEDDPNDDLCGKCGQGGHVLCCDGCPAAYHKECLDIAATPEEDEWFCPRCQRRRDGPVRAHDDVIVVDDDDMEDEEEDAIVDQDDEEGEGVDLMGSHPVAGMADYAARPSLDRLETQGIKDTVSPISASREMDARRAAEAAMNERDALAFELEAEAHPHRASSRWASHRSEAPSSSPSPSPPSAGTPSKVLLGSLTVHGGAPAGAPGPSDSDSDFMTPPDRAAPTSLPTVSVPNDTRTFDRIWVQGIVVRVEREKAPSSSSGQGAPSPKSIALDDGTGVITVDVRGYVKMLRRSFPKLEARALETASRLPSRVGEYAMCLGQVLVPTPSQGPSGLVIKAHKALVLGDPNREALWWAECMNHRRLFAKA